MAVFRIERTRDYTVMSNHHLRNANLSLKAKGLLSMMLSLPEDWNYTTRGLAKICKEGVDAIGAALRELEAAGYIVRHKLRDRQGRISDTEYVIYEQPQLRKPDTDSPDTEAEYAKLLEEKKKTTASGKPVLVKSVRRTHSHRMKFCVQRGLGALPSTSKRRGKSRRDFLLCGPVCINTGIACLFSPKMKRTTERIVKFHSLAQFVSNFSDNSVSSFTVSCV